MKNTANCQIEVNSYYLDLLDAEREKKAEISRQLKVATTRKRAGRFEELEFLNYEWYMEELLR